MKKNYLVPGLETWPIITMTPLCASNEYFSNGDTETLSEEDDFYQL